MLCHYQGTVFAVVVPRLVRQTTELQPAFSLFLELRRCHMLAGVIPAGTLRFTETVCLITELSLMFWVKKIIRDLYLVTIIFCIMYYYNFKAISVSSQFLFIILRCFVFRPTRPVPSRSDQMRDNCTLKPEYVHRHRIQHIDFPWLWWFRCSSC